jgi:hypothetical protein
MQNKKVPTWSRDFYQEKITYFFFFFAAFLAAFFLAILILI